MTSVLTQLLSAQGCLLVGPPGTGKTLLGAHPMPLHPITKHFAWTPTPRSPRMAMRGYG